MVTLVAYIEREVAPIEVAVFNVGANVRFSLAETTERVYRKVWEMAALGGFLMGREVARAMVPRGRGTIIFTGATASVRGAPGFAAFAGAKHALRALAQSMARELGPQGIHVAHVVIDGAIDTRFIAENFPERYAPKDEDGILDPDAIAENYWNLHRQPRERLDPRARPAALDGNLVSAMSERSDSNSSSTSAARPPTWPGRGCPGSPPRPAPRSSGGRCCSAASSRPPATPSPVDGAGQGQLDERRHRPLGAPLRRAVRFNPHFPINTLTLMRGADRPAVARSRRVRALLRRRSRKAMWEDAANIDDPAVLAATLAAAGFDVDGIHGAGRRSAR